MQNAIRRKYAFVLPLPLNNPSSKAALYGLTYFIADENLNPVDENGAVLYENLHVVGANLGGVDFVFEKSLGGVAIASAYKGAIL